MMFTLGWLSGLATSVAALAALGVIVRRTGEALDDEETVIEIDFGDLFTSNN